MSQNTNQIGIPMTKVTHKDYELAALCKLQCNNLKYADQNGDILLLIMNTY